MSDTFKDITDDASVIARLFKMCEEVEAVNLSHATMAMIKTNIQAEINWRKAKIIQNVWTGIKNEIRPDLSKVTIEQMLEEINRRWKKYQASITEMDKAMKND